MQYPWQMPPLNEWAICGMNHYHIDGKRHLFVSMVKDGRCITSEGEDNWVVWNNLCLQADEIFPKPAEEEKSGEPRCCGDCGVPISMCDCV